MYGLNKYKIITISFLLVFILLVGTMYTTTKNAAQRQEIEQEQQEQLQKQAQANDNARLENQQEINRSQGNNIEAQVVELKNQVDYLSRDVENLKAVQSQLKCRVQGLFNNGTVDETSSETAFQEARTNGKEIVLLCSY